MINYKKEIAKSIYKTINIAQEELEKYIEIPPDINMGNYSFPCFRLAKELKKSPMVIAQEINDKIELDEELFEKKEVLNGYVNFFVNKNKLVEEVFKEIDNKKEAYGSSSLGKQKKVVIEFSSPNIAKPFHIGHLRNTVIGAALYNLYKFTGYNVTRLNHLGDYGTQFGKLIEGYKRWGNEYELKDNPIKDLMDIYVKINELCKKDEEVLNKCRDNFKLLEQGDAYCTELWERFRAVSVEEFKKIYDMLDVEFDSLRGEAQCAKDVDKVLEILNKKGKIITSEGAKIVDLEQLDLGVCMLEKSNGSSTYASRDLAAIDFRAHEYNFDMCVYVVGYEQILHLKQIFEVAKYLDIPEKCKNGLKHIPYGLLRLTTGRMSTREGNVVEVEGLLNEAISRVKEIIQEKNDNIDNLEENAKKIGIGAVKFNNLCTTLIKDQIFDLDTILNFNGETGPYIQYTYVRTNSILKNVNAIPKIDEIDMNALLDEDSINVITKIYNFNNIIISAIEKNETSILARYLIDLAKAFSAFYNNNKILVENEKIKNSRVYLTYAVGIVLKTGMGLLGIEMPDKM